MALEIHSDVYGHSIYEEDAGAGQQGEGPLSADADNAKKILFVSSLLELAPEIFDGDHGSAVIVEYNPDGSRSKKVIPLPISPSE